MLDCHCHLDRYPQPQEVARTADTRGVFLVAVTNLPSHFRAGTPFIKAFRRVRLALGIHPLTAPHDPVEVRLFSKLLPETSFVGEVGLDFSRHGAATKAEQLRTFRQVVAQLAPVRKFVSLHSRGAESAVLDVLGEYGIEQAVFHWYTGPARLISEALRAGHFFSLNGAMTRAAKGRKVIELIPQDRVLTESDGPYARSGRHGSYPWDVDEIETYLAQAWNKPQADVRSIVWQNFRGLLARVSPRPS